MVILKLPQFNTYMPLSGSLKANGCTAGTSSELSQSILAHEAFLISCN